MPKPPLIERFRQRYIVDESGCWFWMGHTNGHPDVQRRYGRFCWQGDKVVFAHRASWMLHNGDIPSGMFVCHSCDVPLCVNPDHLFLGTAFSNMHDMASKGRAASQGPHPPRLGTGVGRCVKGKGSVVDTTCSICGTAMLQRVSAQNLGKQPACSKQCVAIIANRRHPPRTPVACLECGKVVQRTTQQIARHTHTFCSKRCTSKHTATAYWQKRRAARA